MDGSFFNQVSTWTIVGVVAAIVSIFVFVKYVVLSPELKYHGFWYKIKSKIIFRAGNIRRLHSAPWVTWDGKDRRQVDLKEVREALSFCTPGTIGLHKDEGYASNLAIPGAFKHAWICAESNDIIEAVQEGVLKRDNLYPLLSDYIVLLRPIGATEEEIKEAVNRAHKIVGCDYDANFSFDLEGEDEDFSDNLTAGKFHHAFSCTETVGFAYYKCKDKLSIFRTKYAGREAIVADDYLRMNFEIVWASKSVTPEWFEKNGMHEQGRYKLSKYLSKGPA